MSFIIERLSAPTTAFSGLTFPRYRPLVESSKENTLAIAASSDLVPVGLALAEFDKKEAVARLLSLAVDASHRRRGLGGGLLRACEAALADLGCREVAAYHSSRLPCATAFAATLRRCGWPPPQVCQVRSAGRCGVLAAAIAEWPGVRRLLRNPDFTFMPWTTLTPTDETAIDRLCQEPACSQYLSPKTWTGQIEPRISTVIRQGEELVGWVLVRLDPEYSEPTLHCEAAYIRHDLWRSGLLVAGYLHVYRAAASCFGNDTILHFHTSPRLPGMMALTRRRFAPVSLWVDDWLESRKRLGG
jgi:GNAT superfamily N-acetyltransferase